MKKTFSILIFLSFSINLIAQNKYPDFPIDQHSYLGGIKEFYKDFHKILIEKNLKSCDNKKEFSQIPIIVKSENLAEVLDINNINFPKHKCSIELTKEVIKHMDKWMPARINGLETPAIIRISIFPDDLFENYKDGYDFIQTNYEKTDFDVENLRKEVVKKINLDSFKFKGNGKLTVLTTFAINYQGKLDVLKIEKSSGSQKYDEMILDAIRQTQKDKIWKPSKTHGMPINSYFSFPLSVSIP